MNTIVALLITLELPVKLSQSDFLQLLTFIEEGHKAKFQEFLVHFIYMKRSLNEYKRFFPSGLLSRAPTIRPLAFRDIFTRSKVIDENMNENMNRYFLEFVLVPYLLRACV